MITEVVLKEQAGFIWVDVINPTEEELVEVALMYQLQLKPVYDCMDTAHLPKHEKHGQTAGIILRCYDEDASEESYTIQELTQKIAIFMDDHVLLTIHRQDTDSFKQIRKYTAYNPKNPREAQFGIFSFILQEVFYSFDNPIEAGEDLFGQFEDSIFDHSATDSLLGDIYLLKRKLSVYRRMLRQSIDVLRKLETHNPEEWKVLEQIKNDGERLISHTDFSIDNLHNLVNLHMSFQSNRTNEIIRVLTIYSAFFMPLTFIVDLYAVYQEGLPVLQDRTFYIGIVCIIFVLCLGIYYWFRKKKWL